MLIRLAVSVRGIVSVLISCARLGNGTVSDDVIPERGGTALTGKSLLLTGTVSAENVKGVSKYVVSMRCEAAFHVTVNKIAAKRDTVEKYFELNLRSSIRLVRGQM